MTHPDPLFLESIVTPDGSVFPLAGFDAWFEERMASHHFTIEQIPFSDLRNWSFSDTTGNLGHASGKFFTIEGIEVETNFGSVPNWRQPIINQPEIGFLGFIAKKFNGVLHFLFQAKMEPGNIRCIQLGPTLQATKSNYTRVHKGNPPPFLEYFQDTKNRKVLVDVLQSEQGGRFLRKRNRNIVIEVAEDVQLAENRDYIWLTLGQAQQLLKRDNVINMDARTVLSCLPFHRHHHDHGDGPPRLHSFDEILTWFTELKCRYDLSVRPIPLKQAVPWERDAFSIHHPSGNYFEVIAVRVEADAREVPEWTQPIVRPCRDGLIAFVTREVDGEPHFLVQAKVEAGNFDVVEMAPTVQCLTGDYRKVPESQRPPFVEQILHARREDILFDSLQSEEGGRFFREENRNVILRLSKDFPTEIPDNYIWISYTQLKEFIRFNNIVNIQARCLLSAVPPHYGL